jgi:GT2 family glycosyltransferase
VDLSFIIVNYKNSESLKDCLISLYQTVQRIDFETIIVDNSENDLGLQPLKELYPKAQFVSNSSNVGFAKANNQAAKIAQGKVLIFLNPDTILSDEAIDSMYRYYCSHTETGVLGPKVVDPEGSLQYS